MLCINRIVAWLIGWSLILEYTLGGAAVARDISTNMAVFFGGPDKLSAFLTRPTILGIVVDPCAAVLVFIITGLLCTGIKEFIGSRHNHYNKRCSLAFHHSSWWIHRFQDSMDIKFQAGISLTSTAEEVKNPQRDVSTVVIGLVPCSQLDPDTPIASAFASYGMNGAV
ncbi:hypothetical protein Lser_V15G09265 [Lactuca serriola]